MTLLLDTAPPPIPKVLSHNRKREYRKFSNKGAPAYDPSLFKLLTFLAISEPKMVRFSFCKNPLEAGNIPPLMGAPPRVFLRAWCPYYGIYSILTRDLPVYRRAVHIMAAIHFYGFSRDEGCSWRTQKHYCSRDLKRVIRHVMLNSVFQYFNLSLDPHPSYFNFPQTPPLPPLIQFRLSVHI